MKKSPAVFSLVVCFLFATFPSISHTEDLSASSLKSETKLALRKLESQNPALLGQKAGDYWSDSSVVGQNGSRSTNPPAKKGNSLVTAVVVISSIVFTGIIIAAVAGNNSNNNGWGFGIGGSC